ncbi:MULTISPECIES: ABC transporter permease [Raoultella]|uniref:ABC transporter permease n=1 Tax=Raoultella TaxID=160674 RepID=UPI0015DBF6F2|nr:ABC transporter permease [Raoultella ornithinolytica]MCC2035648.1 ABC transporter permease [Raoultella ornithinolytica]MCC2040639.1 ABC transporter permease [Raoultella ornithinolytica]MCC2046834.1 ABC transporter permease [Raoultella ornithinolytica]MCC2052870.1 ABC transporter permease [Raoultella ornithinolytica]MCC2059288.1 ABC transporter permease [Raoultella ornithinolytica]
MSQMILKRRRLSWPAIRLNGWPLLLPALIVLLWHIAAVERWMPEQILPAPAVVADTALSLLSGDLLAQWGFSLQHLAVGLLLGVAAGTLLGALFGLVPAAAQRVEPLFYALAQIPTLGWIPLFMVLFGIDNGLKLAVIVKTTLVPMTIHTQLAVTSVSPALGEAAQVMNFSRWQRLRWLVIPASLPGWFTGLRLALSQAWVSLIVVELLASSEGIGYLMVWGRQLFQLDIVFVTIAVVGLSGLLMEWAANRVYARLVFWPQAATGRLTWKPQASWHAFQLPLILLVLWQLASHRGWIDSTLFSSPLAVAQRFMAGAVSGELPVAMLASLGRAFAGGALGIAIGLLCGLLLALRPRAGQILTPTLNVLRHIALFAWLPLLTAWVGNDNGGKIVFIALASFFPMFFSTLQAVSQRDPQLDEVAKVLRFAPLTRLRALILPGAAPGIFAGLRLALIYAWLGNIGAEYFMSSGTGIGSLMINAQQLLDMPTILCGMVLIGITGAALDKAGRLLESRATRWRQQEQL